MSLLVLVGAIWVVSLPNLFRAALSLGLVLIGVAGLFLWLQAEFLAFVQILVYVGAILTLVIFAIMLTSGAGASAPTAASRAQLPAAVLSLLLFLLLSSITQSLLTPTMAEPVTTQALGRELITTLLLPFEVISLVFVAAIIGAVAVAWSTKSGTPHAAR